jgi:hypothetical protein
VLRRNPITGIAGGRARRERPCGCRAAEKGDEITPPHLRPLRSETDFVKH